MRKLLTYIVAFLACGCLAHGQEADPTCMRKLPATMP